MEHKHAGNQIHWKLLNRKNYSQFAFKVDQKIIMIKIYSQKKLKNSSTDKICDLHHPKKNKNHPKALITAGEHIHSNIKMEI